MTLPKTSAILLALALALPARAQTAPAPIIPPAPLAAQKTAPGPATALELDARRALELGLPSIAAQIYQQLLDTTVTAATPVARNRVILALATALIQDDRDDEAAKTLQQFTGSPTPALKLRQAMLDARAPRDDANYAARIAAARATAAALRPENLSPEDKSWLFFLRGLLAEQARDNAAAGTLYQQATAAAVSDIQRAWFELARHRARLRLGEATEAAIATFRKNIADNPGRPLGRSSVSSLAIAYHTLGRPAEAVALLQAQLQTLAPQETARRDEWRLLLGMIAGPDDDAGRAALRDLLADAADRDKQRAALRLLAATALTQPNRAIEFRNLLGQLIASTPPHPILGSLLLFRAQLALAEKPIPNYLSAEKDADLFLKEFPGAKQRSTAHGILTAITWEQGRYRAAASNAAAARDALLPADAPENKNTRAQLNLLIAEAYYRAKDWRNASNAYDYALKQPLPAGVPPGLLMFQHVLSEMQAGAPDTALPAAQKLLDQYAADPRLDPENRWQAEWHLASALQAAGQTAQAYARVNRLLDDTPAAAAVPATLRTRMTWLQARLAHDTGDYTRAIALAEKLLPAPGATDPDRELSAKLLLLQAQAHIALDPASHTTPPAAADILKRLRADYPKTNAAIQSYIVEADAAAKRDQTVQAQNLLNTLIDDHKDDKTYAPYALYQIALYAEQRAQNQYYLDAYNYLERLVRDYPDSDLYFNARLRQGNLLRKLNQFGPALTLYDELAANPKYKFPEYPNALLAELARADTNNALVATDASRAESAAVIYQRLLDLQAAPDDLRVEAGHKFGLILLDRGDTARLETIWWQMINEFLLKDDARAAKLAESTGGGFWMSRTLLKLGEVLEQQNKIAQARELYDLLIRKNLPYAALAQARLAGGRK